MHKVNSIYLPESETGEQDSVLWLQVVIFCLSLYTIFQIWKYVDSRVECCR